MFGQINIPASGKQQVNSPHQSVFELEAEPFQEQTDLASQQNSPFQPPMSLAVSSFLLHGFKKTSYTFPSANLL